MVIHHLYQNDQFCGFSGSSGPSQVTRFGSVLGLGRKGSGGAEDLIVEVRSSPSKLASSYSASNFIERCSSCRIVVVEECAGEVVGAVEVLATVREEDREREDIVRGLRGQRSR
jgi:hypothetical protein